MKELYISFLFAIIGTATIAQVGTKQSRFSYQKVTKIYSQVIDSRVEDLFYNGSESVYVMYAKSLEQTPESTQPISSEGINIFVEIDDPGDGKDFTLYKNYVEGTMILRTAFSNDKKCIVIDSIPKLNWKLEGEKKKIGPYECQKATTNFRCADYIVWFTTAIPLSIGPNKLGGLPGLIVEAVNTRADVTYKLLSAEYPVSKKIYTIAAPQTGDPIYTFGDYRKIELIESDKHRKFLIATAEDPRASEIVSTSPECLEGL